MYVPASAIHATGQLYYIETDQLGTPRQVIKPGATTASDTTVWKWDYFASNSAFGENTPSVQTIAFNLRFPGQYFDSETGLNYNYFRDYEPGTGRYLESDPIGLMGGPSTYSYVSSMPLTMRDSWGLVEDSPANKARRAEIDRIARKYDGSKDWRLMAKKDNFDVGINKCNKFVIDVTNEAGAPLVVNIGSGVQRPPMAGELANVGAVTPNWRVLKPGESRMGGDIPAYRIPGGGQGGSGHTGVITSCDCEGGLSNESAHQDGVYPIPGQWDLPDTVIRRYTGE